MKRIVNNPYNLAKENVDIKRLKYGYTLEHIMPQNPDLSDEWKEELDYDIKPNIYIVKKDDTLKKIAKKFNITVDYLMKINNIQDYKELYPGQRLIIDN